jgi:CheY-like chemotaxis protein
MLEREVRDPRDRRSGAVILVVDDDADFLHALASILLDEGYHVITAAHGEAALSYLRSSPQPDLILLNLVMPVMNGWTFLDELRQDPESSGIPVVLLSGISDLREQAATLGVSGYMAKPIEVRLLIEAVNRHCL